MIREHRTPVALVVNDDAMMRLRIRQTLEYAAFAAQSTGAQ